MRALLRQIFTPPPLQTTDYVHESKYILSYRMSIFFAITIGILDSVLFLFFGFSVGLVAFIILLIVVGCIVHIRKTGTYITSMILFNCFGSAACLYTLFFLQDQPHITDSQWMIINILFSFLVLGYRWGIFFSVLHGTSITYFFAVHVEEQLMIFENLTDAQVISMSLNILICFCIIGYLGWQNIRTNELAKKQLNHAQDVLQEQYNIISKQNEEKTVMLKEIHHRVKNNLQIITSLLRLQSRELESPEAIAKFKDATHRVIAMSMIHEKMYQSDHLSTMHLREYLHDLSSDLVSSYQSGYPIELSIDCDVDSIGLRSIVPLALILNELISNSLKYAFDDDESNKISIVFTRHNNNQVKLTYADSGTWKAPTRQGSFGLDLIESLTDQLEGVMELKTFPETKFEFIFNPLEDE